VAARVEDVSGPWFEDVVEGSGIDFRHASGATGRYWFPEIVTGGACLLDVDGDGRLDLYFVQGGSAEPGVTSGPGNRLYRNLGDWKFEDVTAAAGVAGRGTYGMGCTTGDYDADGDADLYVTNVVQDILYRNDGGGSFTDVTQAAGMGDDAWGTSAGFLDLDADADLDLVVVNYIHWTNATEKACYSRANHQDYCSPKSYKAPGRAILYENRGDGSFVDATVSSGMAGAVGNGLGLTFGDFDLDGKPDIYVANDGTPGHLWMNQGGLRFVDRGMATGCAVDQYGWAEAGMGVQAIDIDDDGDLDIYRVHLEEETNTLYTNARGTFRDATDDFGLGKPSLGFTGFGMGFADFDQDGWLDCYVANGRVKLALSEPETSDPYNALNQVFRGLPSGRFEELMPRGGTAAPVFGTSRAAAFGDLDDDGDVDVVVANRDGRPHVLRNLAGSRGRSIELRVLDRRGLDALGANVRVRAAGRDQRRQVQVAYSYLASNDPRVHFGLGAATTADEVEIAWPDGVRESFGALEAGLHVLRQSSGRPSSP